jgi:hypothetical protein
VGLRLGTAAAAELQHVPVEDAIVGEALPMEQVPEQLPQIAETSKEPQDESSSNKGLTGTQQTLIQNSPNPLVLFGQKITVQFILRIIQVVKFVVDYHRIHMVTDFLEEVLVQFCYFFGPDLVGSAKFWWIRTVSISTKCEAKLYFFLENFKILSKIKIMTL